MQLAVNTGLSAEVFTGDARYLQVEVHNSDTGTWEVLSPRLRLTSTAFALRAGDAETLGGHEASELDQSSHVTDTSNPHHVTAAQVGADPAGSAASVQANLDSHAADPAAHHARYTDAEAVAAVKASDGSGSGLDADLLDGNDASACGSAVQQAKNTSNISDLQGQINALKATVAAQAAAIAALETKLEHMSSNGTDVFFSGVNVHIVNGTNSTGGPVNGLGNLIVGYNASRGSGDDRTGSHNIVVGDQLNYSSYGGLVVGYHNTISGGYSSVSGGYFNTASGSHSSVSGGRNNTASGAYSFVVGGGGPDEDDGNQAFGNYSSVLGGWRNIAGDPATSDHSIGQQSVVTGGTNNNARGDQSSVSGGYINHASGTYSSVSGGAYNTASGGSSSVSGGRNRSASGAYDWRAGSLFEEN